MLLFGVFLLATGCATSAPNVTAVPQAPADKAVVYLYRPERVIIGAGGWMEVKVDGESLGKLRNGNYIVYSTSPGAHSFQYRYSHPPAAPIVAALAMPEGAASDGPKVDFRLEAGKVYYVVYPAQKLVDQSKALMDLSDCQLVERKEN